MRAPAKYRGRTMKAAQQRKGSTVAHHISPAEKQRRQDSVAAAIHSAWLEGAEVSQETQDDMQEYVEGGITVEEGLARLRERIDRHVRERRNTVA